MERKVKTASDVQREAALIADRFRGLLDSIPDSIVIVDHMGLVVLVNKQGQELFQYSHDELVGQPVEILVPARYREKHAGDRAEYFADLRIRPMQAGLDLVGLRKDGVEVPVDISLSPLKTEEGLFVVSAIRNITERKRLELQQIEFRAQRLHESEERFRQIAETISEVFWIADYARQKLFYVSPAYEKVWGRSCQNLYEHPRSFLDAVHPDDHDRVLSAIKNQLHGGLYQSEYRIVRPDGTMRWISDRGYPIRDENGQLSRFVGIAQDITDARRTLDELRESERRFNDMLGKVQLVSLMLDANERITYCNDFLLNLTGWQREEVMGRNWFEMFISKDPQDLTDVKQTFAGLLKDLPPTWHHENEILTRSGERRLIRWNNSVLRSVDGIVIGTASIGEDVTERERLERQLRQAQKMEAIGQLAGGVAHDFNNLLTVINGRSELMLLRMDPANPLRSDISLIHQTGERAANLTRQLLAFSRRQMLQPRTIDLNQIVNDIFKMLNRLVPENISIATVLDPELHPTRADPGRIEQVLINLVVNARDAMPSGGKLLIETANLTCDKAYQAAHPAIPLNNYVTLSVSDNGCGMTEEVKSRIFEPFFTTKEQGKGTGLGLATVFGIIQQSKGQISVQSEPCKGATFVIYLPQQNDELGSPHRSR
jgi:PAS domain S-box-containing protein